MGKVITSCIHQFYEDKAKELGIKKANAASITFTQMWGSSVNLNPQLHTLALDGVYSLVRVGEDEVAKLKTVDAIANQETAALLDKITKKIVKKLKRKEYLDQDGEVVQHPELDSLFADHDSLAQATASSIGSTIAFGPNAGSRVSRIGSGFGFAEEIPLAKGNRCYHQDGFSIHAERSVNIHSRNKLEELIQYMVRGPISNDRIKL